MPNQNRSTRLNRFYRRAELALPISFSLENNNQCQILGSLVDISAAGACLKSTVIIPIGSIIYLNTLPHSEVGINNLPASIVRAIDKDEGNDNYLYGLSFSSKDSVNAVDLLIKRYSTLSLELQFPINKALIFFAMGILLPGTIFAGWVLKPNYHEVSFTCFIAFLCLERFWEVYLNGRERKKTHTWGDWTLLAVTFYYAVVLELMSIEFFVLRQGNTSLRLSEFGALLLLMSLCLRWWSTKSLQDQWAIRILPNPERQARQRRLVAVGPYRFVRHPIYSAYFIELIAITLIANCYLTLAFALLVNVPIQLIRTSIEEKELLATLGESYAEYKQRVPPFIPKLFSKTNKERRRVKQIVDFSDRRKKSAIKNIIAQSDYKKDHKIKSGFTV